MRPFKYERAENLKEASRLAHDTGQGQIDAPTQFLAGGTTVVDLMRLDVLRPQRLIDIKPLHDQLGQIETSPDGLRLGALVTMAVAQENPTVLRDFPVIAQSLRQAASAQLRNMATLGGNVLQRTRCPYYRDPSWSACNKRRAGSGCSAMESFNRNHAVLGVDDSCIAQYPGDLGVALAALGAQIELSGRSRSRLMAFEDLHRPAHGRPDAETALEPGELIMAFQVPAGPWTRRSVYLKIRDRASYEFALASAAVALDLDGGTVRAARIGLGGVAYRPWRAHEAEALLTGKPLTEATAQAAAEVAFAAAVTHGGNDFKPELGRRTLVRALIQARDLEL